MISNLSHLGSKPSYRVIRLPFRRWSSSSSPWRLSPSFASSDGRLLRSSNRLASCSCRGSSPVPICVGDKKKLLQEAVGRIETDTPPSQTPEVFYRFVSERSMTYALAAHVVKRNGVFKTHDANQTVDKQTISGDSANAHGSNPPIHDEDAKTNDSNKVQ